MSGSAVEDNILNVISLYRFIIGKSNLLILNNKKNKMVVN